MVGFRSGGHVDRRGCSRGYGTVLSESLDCCACIFSLRSYSVPDSCLEDAFRLKESRGAIKVLELFPLAYSSNIYAIRDSEPRRTGSEIEHSDCFDLGQHAQFASTKTCKFV